MNQDDLSTVNEMMSSRRINTSILLEQYMSGGHNEESMNLRKMYDNTKSCV